MKLEYVYVYEMDAGEITAIQHNDNIYVLDKKMTKEHRAIPKDDFAV